ncbi:YbeD family protein [Mariprofundus ferrooxydans]|uniref:YbeD family protein n=2 Tax=Mariprofundus ferrooxydans TaxID=314344 RepID=UPI0003682A86|nr:DUF493 domain-containing protein [Mariprofundus ferrooxydans]
MTDAVSRRNIGLMNDSTQTSPLTFPCRFPVKVMGSNSDHFREDIVAIAREHFTPLDEADITVTASRTAKYLSVSVIVTAESREQLDNLYRAINAHPDVRMVL